MNALIGVQYHLTSTKPMGSKSDVTDALKKPFVVIGRHFTICPTEFTSICTQDSPYYLLIYYLAAVWLASDSTRGIVEAARGNPCLQRFGYHYTQFL